METTNELLKKSMNERGRIRFNSKNVLLKKPQPERRSIINKVENQISNKNLNKKYEVTFEDKNITKGFETERNLELASRYPKLKIDVDMADVIETCAKSNFQAKNIENFNFRSLKETKGSYEISNLNSPNIPSVQTTKRKDMHTAIQNYTGCFSMRRRQNSQSNLQREKLGYVLLDTLKDNNCDSNLLKNFEFCQENIKHKIKTILLSHQVKLFDSNRRFKISSAKDLELLKASIDHKYDKESIKKDPKLHSEYLNNK